LRHRNAGGEWRVEKQRLHWDLLDAFAEAATEAGIPATSDFNQGDNHGVGYFEVNQRSGWRWNTAKAFCGPPATGAPTSSCGPAHKWPRSLLEANTRPQADTDEPCPLRCTGVQVWNGQEMVDRDRPRRALPCGGQHRLTAHLCSSLAWARRRSCRPTASRWRKTHRVWADNLQDHLQIRAVYQVRGARTLNTQAQLAPGQGAHRTRIRLQAQLAP